VQIVPRHLTEGILESLGDTPVVLLVGARQSGKSTIARSWAQDRGASYITLDSAMERAAALADPAGFLAGLRTPAVIDEIQRAPDLLLEIKLAIDQDRRPGAYLLTGSANVPTMPSVADSLAGRMAVLTLWPFSQGETIGVRERFVERAFDSGAFPNGAPLARADILERVARGGFPEALARPRPDRRREWMRNYVAAVVDRDVRDMARIERLTDVPALLEALAHRTAGVLNTADVGRLLAVPATTLNRYLALLERVYLVSRIPAWHRNAGRRLAKSPKLLVTDTGLAAELMGLDPTRSDADPVLVGRLLETFVGMELLKQIGWTAWPRPRLLHFRTAKGQEVDFVLERPSGECVGIEVKLAQTIRPDDFRGLRVLADTVGDRFVRGIVLHAGERTVSFGERLIACPLAALWAE